MPSQSVADRNRRGAWVLCVLLFLLVPATTGADLTQLMRRLGYYPIPLYFDDENRDHLQVHAKVNGRPANLVLDSGAPQTAISQRSAKTAVPLLAGQQLIADYFIPSTEWTTNADGRIATKPSPLGNSESIVLIQRLELGAAVFEQVPATVSITRKARRVVPVDYILGADFLVRHHAVVGCAEHMLYLRGNAPRPAILSTLDESLKRGGLSEVRLDFSRDGNRWHVPMAFGGRGFALLLDTGAATSLLDKQFVKASGFTTRETPMKMGNIFGELTPMDRVDVQNLRIGSFGLPRAFFGVIDLESLGLGEDRRGRASGETFRGKPVEGILGMDLLARNLGVIDCTQHKLWLKKVLDQ